ncbi:hypothetical protein PC114_g4980 [Phytophthora cactorum]|nr:hypothetical protein PC114_g4980 [Phytophthora cactorum]
MFGVGVCPSSRLHTKSSMLVGSRARRRFSYR